MPMHLLLLVVAIVVFAVDAFSYWTSGNWGGRLQSIGLAFFAASFAVGG